MKYLFEFINVRGEIGRKKYSLYLVLSLFCMIVAMLIETAIVKSVNGSSIFFFLLVGFYLSAVSVIKRLRNMGFSIWWVLVLPLALFKMPLLNLIINITGFDLDYFLARTFPNMWALDSPALAYIVFSPFVAPFLILLLLTFIYGSKSSSSSLQTIEDEKLA